MVLRRNRPLSQKAKEQLSLPDPIELDGRPSEDDDDSSIKELIIGLKETIRQQNRNLEETNKEIRKARTDIQEVKQEQQILKNQNTALKEQVFELQTQLNTFLEQPSGICSWATVAAGHSAADRNQTAHITNYRTRNEAMCIQISTQPTNNSDEVADNNKQSETLK